MTVPVGNNEKAASYYPSDKFLIRDLQQSREELLHRIKYCMREILDHIDDDIKQDRHNLMLAKFIRILNGGEA